MQTIVISRDYHIGPLKINLKRGDKFIWRDDIKALFINDRAIDVPIAVAEEAVRMVMTVERKYPVATTAQGNQKSKVCFVYPQLFLMKAVSNYLGGAMPNWSPAFVGSSARELLRAVKPCQGVIPFISRDINQVNSSIRANRCDYAFGKPADLYAGCLFRPDILFKSETRVENIGKFRMVRLDGFFSFANDDRIHSYPVIRIDLTNGMTLCMTEIDGDSFTGNAIDFLERVVLYKKVVKLQQCSSIIVPTVSIREYEEHESTYGKKDEKKVANLAYVDFSYEGKSIGAKYQQSALDRIYLTKPYVVEKPIFVWLDSKEHEIPVFSAVIGQEHWL